MNQLIPLLTGHRQLFDDDRQALIYLSLLRDGPAGAEVLSQRTHLHRETIQRELVKMAGLGTTQLFSVGRNKKARAVPIASLQDILETKREEFGRLLKPLLAAEAAGRLVPTTQTVCGSYKYGILQMHLIRRQPPESTIKVLSTQPRQWAQAMIDARKLDRFERLRLEKKIHFRLSCFEERRGEVEHNNREYFYNQPPELKRSYRYVAGELSSPLQIQIWEHMLVMSIFASDPSIHLFIEDKRVAAAFASYFEILWESNG